jgi:hypothetical protein
MEASMKKIRSTAMVAAALVIIGATALGTAAWAQYGTEALKEQMVGTWKLVAYRSQRVGEPVWRDTLGANPKGYAIITPEGRYMHLLLGEDRKPPKSDADRAALLGSMTAWSGKYQIVGHNEFHVLVDTSWSEAHRDGRQKQVRFVSFDGNRMTLRTPPQLGARSVTRNGQPRTSVTEFVFEREE